MRLFKEVNKCLYQDQWRVVLKDAQMTMTVNPDMALAETLENRINKFPFIKRFIMARQLNCMFTRFTIEHPDWLFKATENPKAFRWVLLDYAFEQMCNGRVNIGN